LNTHSKLPTAGRVYFLDLAGRAMKDVVIRACHCLIRRVLIASAAAMFAMFLHAHVQLNSMAPSEVNHLLQNFVGLAAGWRDCRKVPDLVSGAPVPLWSFIAIRCPDASNSIFCLILK
jgi:hypothetical protein